MKVVGVKELKARLSEYLRTVRRGETLLVTERGEVIAEIRPAPRSLVPARTEGEMEKLIEAGEVTRAELPKENWRWTVKGLGLPDGTVTALLDELRGERE
jgi:prevent-host-death family protein